MARGRWLAMVLVATLGGLGASCSDDEVEDEATGGSGGSGGATGGTGGASGGSGGSTGGAAGSSGAAGSGGSAGSAGAAGSGGAAGGSGGAAGSDAGDASADSDAGDAASDAPATDAGANYPAVLFQGVWYAGWAGGLDHFSWMKFTESAPGQGNGSWAALDSKCTSCTPYFQCEGKDGLFIASKTGPMTLTLQYPSACPSDSGGPSSEEWTFQSFSAAGSFPPGAVLQASVQVGTNPSNLINAYLYPSSQCNPAFNSCTNPF